MGNRLALQTLLEALLGSRNVYYQPPASVKMKYPAIVYSRDTIQNSFADDQVYKQSNRYSITVIDADPDSEIVAKVSKLPRTTYNHGYQADNLNHDVFELYY